MWRGAGFRGIAGPANTGMPGRVKYAHGFSPFVELEIGGRTVKVTNPDKVFYRKLKATKLDHVQYYVSVAEGIVRCTSGPQLKRHPDGAEGRRSTRSACPRSARGIETARVTFPSGRHADELCVTEVAQVAWAANLATIDFHPWPSRRAHVDNPDELRIDVDPQPGTTFKDAKKVALLVREVLDELGFAGWPKTSGNRGIHIACRIEPNWTFPCAGARWPSRGRSSAGRRRRSPRRGGRRSAPRLHRLQPERARPDDRSAYSVRARPDATVSAPVTWDELTDVETEDFTPTMPKRFAKLGDVQAGIDDAVCDLRKLFEWVERDEKEGIGEAAYPPQFPKMPGEPKRVQPSRDTARKARKAK